MHFSVIALVSALLASCSLAQDSASPDNRVEKLNLRNFQRKLTPKVEYEEEWLIYNTGGNKTCFGNCAKADEAWSEAVPLLQALPQPAGRPKLRLARVDCELDTSYCTGLGVTPPSVWHISLAQAIPGQETGKSPLRIVYMSVNHTVPGDFLELPLASDGKVLIGEPYEGSMHPVDGWLVTTGLITPFAYVVGFMGGTPSFVLMITISFITRQFMSSRIPTARPVNQGPAGAQPAQGAAGTAPTTATTTGSSAKGSSGGKGGKKRR